MLDCTEITHKTAQLVDEEAQYEEVSARSIPALAIPVDKPDAFPFEAASQRGARKIKCLFDASSPDYFDKNYFYLLPILAITAIVLAQRARFEIEA